MNKPDYFRKREIDKMIPPKEEPSMPDMKMLDEALTMLRCAQNNDMKTMEYNRGMKTALSILSHVKENGLTLSETEIDELIWDIGQDVPLSIGDTQKVAKSIVAKQKGLI